MNKIKQKVVVFKNINITNNTYDMAFNHKFLAFASSDAISSYASSLVYSKGYILLVLSYNLSTSSSNRYPEL